MDDKTIDVVSIAIPNHWHVLASIWAIQSGKDVYVEKPLGHNIWEQRRLVEASRKHNRLVQMGNYTRSLESFRSAVAYLRAGTLGKIKLAHGICYNKRGSIRNLPDAPVPAGVDYNLWQGPAAERPFNPNRFHYNWHWNFEYGGGEIANNGIYYLDIARWGLGKSEHPKRAMSVGGRVGYEDDGNTPNSQIAVLDYGDVQIIQRSAPPDDKHISRRGTSSTAGRSTSRRGARAARPTPPRASSSRSWPGGASTSETSPTPSMPGTATSSTARCSRGTSRPRCATSRTSRTGWGRPRSRAMRPSRAATRGTRPGGEWPPT